MLETDEALYRSVNKAMIDIYNELYSKDDYLKRIEKLVKRQFDIFPRDTAKHAKSIRL
jgi:hypothetical protein